MAGEMEALHNARRWDQSQALPDSWQSRPAARLGQGRTVHSRDMGYSTPDIREKALW